MNNKLALFEEKEIRRAWEEGKWYFSVVDVVFALTDSKDPRDYWYRLKQRVSEEEKIELSTICRRLKLVAADGKYRLTDCADTEGILRIIQSIPSKKQNHLKDGLLKLVVKELKRFKILNLRWIEWKNFMKRKVILNLG